MHNFMSLPVWIKVSLCAVSLLGIGVGVLMLPS